jgi:hypothetical protein
MLHNARPIRLSRRPEPFDSEEYLYELNIDGFRALAQIAGGKRELISRNGNVFRGFAELATWIAKHLKVESALRDKLLREASQSNTILLSADQISRSLSLPSAKIWISEDDSTLDLDGWRPIYIQALLVPEWVENMRTVPPLRGLGFKRQ